MSCDCRINYEQVILYCPLHQAAGDLLEALEAIEEMVDDQMGEWAGVQPPYFPQHLLGIWNIREAARAAVAKAQP